MTLPDGQAGAKAGRTLPSARFRSGIGDVLDALNFAAMGTFEARHDRCVLLADAIYLDLRTEGDTPAGILFDRAKGRLHGFVFSRYGGFRVSSLAFEATLFPAGPFPEVSRSSSETWVDPVVGEIKRRTEVVGTLKAERMTSSAAC